MMTTDERLEHLVQMAKAAILVARGQGRTAPGVALMPEQALAAIESVLTEALATISMDGEKR